jgi:hypothetical protein
LTAHPPLSMTENFGVWVDGDLASHRPGQTGVCPHASGFGYDRLG